jgi:hypothetical protein
MSETLGYIVTGKMGAMELAEYDDAPKLLLAFGRNATLFPSRAAAKAAVDRSTRYSIKHGLGWETWTNHRIVPVREAEVRRGR